MNLFSTSRKTLSLFTLFAAGTLHFAPTLAADEAREQISVSDEAGLRAALSEKYQPDGTTEEKDKRYRDNADITLSGNISVTTTRTVSSEIKDAEGNVTGTQETTYADNSVEILANNSKLFGAGHTVFSSEIALDVKGSGDLFFLSGNAFTVENITFAGTSDSTRKTGRVFTTGNTLFSTLLIDPGTSFENRRLVADEFTNYRAHGGALVSAHIMDEVWLKSSASAGNITFSGNVAHGKSLSYVASGETVTENLSAFGGAISASGLLSVYGDGTAIFEKNAALSDAATAAGGAIFIVNASLNKDGSLSTASVYPDSVIDETGKKKFGLQATGTVLTFSGNSAQGANAQGGAVAVSGGYFDAEKSEINFSGNSAKNTLAGGKILGGALFFSDGAKSEFDAETTLLFENNLAEAGDEKTAASGGALAVSDASLSLAGTATFSGNTVKSAFSGATLSGGAIFFAGTQKNVTLPDGTKTQEHTTNVTLAGTLNFSGNSVSATALASAKDTGTPEKPATETIQSSAQGGAVALGGGKIDGSGLASLGFSENFVEAKTFAQGGALASLDKVTDLTLKTSGEFSFSKNRATLLALASGEAQTENSVPVAQGGAVYISSGTLNLSASGTLNFSENAVDASAQENALAQGGAIFQSAGTLTLGAAGFSKNKVTSRVAQGGAVYAAGGGQNFSGDVNFSDNQALAGTETSPAGTTFARGGALFAETSATLNFSGTTEFLRNAVRANSVSGTDALGKRSGVAGGAVYSSGTLNFGELRLANGTAAVAGDANGAAFGGGVYVAGGTFSADSLTALSLSAAAAGDAHGGAIYAESAGLIDVSGDFSASGNSVRGIGSDATKNASGGAIFLAGTLRVGGGFSAQNNKADGATASGGAATVSGGIFTVSGESAHEISGNSANASGGNAFGGGLAVRGGTFRQSAGTLDFSGNAVSASGGNAFGGAVYLSGGSVEFTNADFSGNTVSASGGTALGGAVFIDAGPHAASTLKFSGNTKIAGNSAAVANDGIYVGVATGTEAKSAVSVIFDTTATLTENDDGSLSRTEVESALISDKITADKATLVLTKTGAGDLTLGEIVSVGEAKISANFEGGVSTLTGTVAALETLFVADGAEVSLQSEFGGYKTAEIAGTLNAAPGSAWNFSADSETKLTGTLALDGVAVKISGASKISGAGTFSVKNGTAFEFADAAAHLTTATLSVGTGTLTLSGAGTLDITGKLVFSEAGSAEIVLSDEATSLGLVEVARTAKGDVSAKISGTGTLVLYTEAGDTEPPTEISFSEFFEKIKDETTGEETTTVYKGMFEIADSVKVQEGIAVARGVTLKLSPDAAPDANFVGKKNILLTGGTLLTDAGKTLELETLKVSGETKSVLGVAGENQTFKMVEVTENGTDADGNPTSTTKTNALALSGELEITETTTFVGDVVFGGKNSAVLSGAGTLEGNLSGTGEISLAKIIGNVNIENGTTITAGGPVSVAGDVNIYYNAGTPATGTTANAILKLAANANFSAQNIYNYGRIVAGNATALTGNIVNAGTLIVEKDSVLKIDGTSTFTNGDAAQSLAGTIDLSALNSAIDFSAIADEANIVLNNGTVRIDATKLAQGDALPIAGIEDETIFENLKIEDVGNYVLSDRFVWDAAAEKFVFLGLNGERFRGTLYGDLQRESLNATYDFMRQTLMRSGARTLTPELYGAYKLQSPYMRGYIEKVRQRGGEVSARLEAKRKAELAMAEKLNSRTVNFWAQGNASFGEHRERKGFDAYDSERIGALAGASLPLENWELGLAIAGSEENCNMHAATRHEVETSAYGISGYAFYKNGWFDWTAGTAGMLFSSDSKRGEYSGDFDGWRLGVMTEFGATLRAQSWLAIRAFAGLSAAYSYVGAFDESGGEGALCVDSDGAAGVRGNVGISSAFLLSDTLQLKVRAAWLVDFGNDTCSLDAYMPGTRTDYVIDSRENESSALEAGASLNWTFSESTEVFVDYTGTIRAGERDNAVSVGLNYFF